MQWDAREPEWTAPPEAVDPDGIWVGSDPDGSEADSAHHLWSGEQETIDRESLWGRYASWAAPQPADSGPADEDRFVRCPFCGRWARRTRPGGLVFAVIGGLATIGLLVGLSGGLARLGPSFSWVAGVAWVVIGMGAPLLRRVLRPLTVPEDCPHCGGPMRIAVLSDWGRPEGQEDPYQAPRWMPND
ncbi:MAG: hypothetical protein GX134_12555 [candidate division WS1 bacterium]|nr:hypothetical protein [candidate division WS1 bacterium]